MTVCRDGLKNSNGQYHKVISEQSQKNFWERLERFVSKRQRRFYAIPAAFHPAINPAINIAAPWISCRSDPSQASGRNR